MADRLRLLNMILQDAPGGKPSNNWRGRGRGKRGASRFGRAQAASGRGRTTGILLSEGTILRNTEGLSRMATYCMNEVECRRQILLSHFDEKFDPGNCDPKCDNCMQTGGVICEVDVSSHAIALVNAIECMMAITNGAVTNQLLVEFYVGRKSRFSNNMNVMKAAGFGAGKGVLKDHEILRIVEDLIQRKILAINVDVGLYHQVTSFLVVTEDRILLEKLHGGHVRFVLKSRGTQQSSRKRPLSRSVETGRVHSEARNNVRSFRSSGIEATSASAGGTQARYVSPYFTGKDSEDGRNSFARTGVASAAVFLEADGAAQATSEAVTVLVSDEDSGDDCVAVVAPPPPRRRRGNR
jgi:superfamily II DNA helicase RecQ